MGGVLRSTSERASGENAASRRKSRVAVSLGTGHNLGKGKELLLMPSGQNTGISRVYCADSELIRMHEQQACEIPLLPSRDSTIRATAATVPGVRSHVDGPT
jgi:hypothetical protein